jgi:isoquinoline 1-oxidoreductase beta subunit
MKVDWNDGPVAGLSDQDILSNLKSSQLPMPSLPSTLVSKSIAADFTFYFRSNAELDSNSANADLRYVGAEIWGSFKNPIICGQQIAGEIGVPQGNVKVHVVEGGGSFGRRVYSDAAMEAAQASKAMGVPVKLMWDRADDVRVGRTHPMATSRVRTSYALGQVLAFHQSHTSVETDFRHGLGEVITGIAADMPLGLGNLPFAQVIFNTTSVIPYDFGVLLQTLVETDTRFNTAAMRNVYSPDVRTANELVVDQLAKGMRKDPLRFRLEFLRNPRIKRCLQEAGKRAGWGKELPPGVAQGIGVHTEYKGATACIVEIDCRPATVNRNIHNGVGGPRVTKATMVCDVGTVINPTGVEAQMQGCINDALAMTLTSGLHLKDGHFLESSWDSYFYTRQWNTPPEVDVVILPSDEPPGGAGEAGVASANAAIACAYARATGVMPTEFPILHREPLAFTPLPTAPPVPASPTDGLSHTF